MNKQEIILKKYIVDIWYSDDGTGDMLDRIKIEAENFDRVWDYIFKAYYKDGQKVQNAGQFLDGNCFTFDEYWSESRNELVLFDELPEEDVQYNEYDELENYSRSITLTINEDED